MTTRPTAQPASQSASTPASAASPSLNWQYPFPRPDLKPITTPQDVYKSLAQMDDGYFPLGVNGFPHGGIHFGAAASKSLDLSGGVRCIADGDIVAYKVDDAYPQLHFTQSGSWAMYSTGFVLMRHRLTMPPDPKGTGPQPEDESHYVFCLYMHLADWSTYLGDGKLDRPWWWQGVDAYRVGNKARQDTAKQGGSLGAAGAFVWTEPKAGKKANQLTPGQHVGFLPEGSEITIGEKRGKWGHITAIMAGGMISPTEGGIFGEEGKPVPWKHDDDATPKAPVTPDGDWGWLWLPDLQANMKEPLPVNTVVVLPSDMPIRVKAGTLMGQLGEYHDYERSSPLPPVAKRQLLHMEVFADEGFTAFLAKCRERATKLPSEQRTILVINKGAKLISKLPQQDVTLRPAQEWAVTRNCPTTGRWAYTWTRDIHPVTKVRTEVDGPIWAERTDMKTSPASGKAWRNFPLQLAAADTTVGFTGAYPRAMLDSLPANCKATDTDGKHWFYVQFGTDAGDTASGWVREQGHPGTEWRSPWAWPEFEIVDATGINLADAFKHNIVISGTADYKEQKEFEPSFIAVKSSALLYRLQQIISKLPDQTNYTGKSDKKKDDKPTVTAAKMRNAMRKAWLSDELAHIILKYESEWSGNMARWEALTPLMRNARENWKCELQRIKKLQFWNEVKSVVGFPATPTVLHIHPVALVANFQSRDCINVEEFLRIYESEHMAFDASTHPLDEESKNHLRILLTGIIAIYRHQKKNDCNIRYIAYMLATARHETAKYIPNLQKTIYFKPVTEGGASSYFNKYDPILADTVLRRQTAIQNGNTTKGDGYTYRGRGYVQLTWKDNYRKVGEIYGVDLVENPDRALEPEIAAFAMVYGMENGIFTRKKLSNYISDTTSDYLNARRIINGIDQAERIAGYALRFESIIKRSRQ